MYATSSEAVGEVIPSQCDLVPQGRSSNRGKDEAQSDVPVPPLELVGAPTVSHGSSEAAAFKGETIVIEATLHLKTPCAKELVANDSFSFSEMIQTIFEIELGMKFSVTSAGSVKVISATAIRMSLSTPGCDLVAARILSWASKMADVLQDWLADHELGYTISSEDGVTAVLQGGPDTATWTAETINVEATMHLGSPCAKNILALDSSSVMIQEVFARILSVNISTIRVGSLGDSAA